jgi:hypothetical protein
MTRYHWKLEQGTFCCRLLWLLLPPATTASVFNIDPHLFLSLSSHCAAWLFKPTEEVLEIKKKDDSQKAWQIWKYFGINNCLSKSQLTMKAMTHLTNFVIFLSI